MKKILAVLLALIMVLGLVACGATTETTTETEKTETTTTETKEEPKKEETKEEEKEEAPAEEEWPLIEASALVFTSTGFTPPAESEGVDYYRDNYGLALEVLPVDISQTEAWNIFWAGGGYSDIILPYGGSQARQIVAEGICRTIEYDWFKEYMPRLYTLLMKVYGSDEAALAALEINGDVYCIPYFSESTNVGFNTAFRNDWLENLGIEAPKDGMTVAELEEIVRAFAEDDPDGNGIDDTYAFTGGDSYGVYSLAAAFGTSPSISYYTAEDGASMYTNATSDEYRNYISTLAKWYGNGWIDPEYLTDDRAADRNKLAAGTIGIYSDNPWWWELSRGDVGPLQMLSATQEGLNFTDCVTFVTDLTSEVTGELVHNSDLGWINGQASVYFGYETSDDVVIRMMKILDEGVRLFTFDEEDVAAIRTYSERSWGHEGEHWEVDEIGRVVQTNPMTAEESSKLGQYMFPIAAGSDLEQYAGNDDHWNKDNYLKAMGQNRIYKGSDRTLPTLSTISTELGDKATNVNDFFSTSKARFITGELDVNDDAVWAEYVATLEEYGINDIVAAYEEYFGM